MVRSVTTKAKHAITNAAQRSVENVRSVAGDAFGAAAKAAADVVLVSTSNALETGRAKVRQVAPAMKQAIGIAAKETVSKPRRRKKVAKRKVARKKTASRRKTKRRARR